VRSSAASRGWTSMASAETYLQQEIVAEGVTRNGVNLLGGRAHTQYLRVWRMRNDLPVWRGRYRKQDFLAAWRACQFNAG
jgi:hypothetical protein